MRALYFPGVVKNNERRWGNQYQTTGSSMFMWSALSALLEHGTYDAYFVAGLTEQKKDEMIADGLAPRSVARLVDIRSGSKLPLAHDDKFIMTDLGPQLCPLATLRNKLRRFDAPVCGLIHSMSSESIVYGILQQCFAGLTDADLLLCSSRAGLKTMETYIEEVQQLLQPRTIYQPRRVLVPPGVTIPCLDPKHRVTLRERLNVGPEENIVLFFGRLSQISQGDLGPLLVAFSIVLSRDAPAHLIIAGDDTQVNEAPRLAALANELKCRRNLTIWPSPSTNEKHMFYSGADVFVSLGDNVHETFGLAVAEAMSYGLPAVVSDWDGYRDIVSDGDTGFLIPTCFPSNIGSLELRDSIFTMVDEGSLAQSTSIDIRELSKRIFDLVRDSELRKRMGRAARRAAEQRFGWSVIVKRYEELWEESITIAKAVSREGARRSPVGQRSLEKTFGQFATRKRSLECPCFITSQGREWLKRPARLKFLCSVNDAPSLQRFVRILVGIADRPGICVAKVIETFIREDEGSSEADAHWSLGRLFKYGLVTGVDERVAVARPPNHLQATPRPARASTA